MALLTRELELIIIARDHTQSTTARVAGALTFIGAAIARMGIAWSAALGEMTSDAIDFRNGAALAFTQMFEVADASIEDIQDAMLRVGREVPVAFDELSEAMFDIFSSLEATVPEAEVILRRVAQAAVAGQTDVRSAMISTIATMNAFGLGVEDIDFILDQQFTTVQRGILTYEEYTASVGKIIPAAKAAGQDIETMGATFAFLTRNGLTAAMASTSAARAFELFAQPKTVKNLEDAGIAVRDATGEFRQINEVLADMDKIFGGLTAPERKEKFIEIFGQGRIQARRFFDIAIPNWREFNNLVDVFTSEETLGAMKRAYDIMMDQPKQKLQVLRNRWEALRFEIGMRFIPLLEDKIIPFFSRLLDVWEELDEVQKDNLVRWAAFGAIGTTVLGILVTLIGIGKLLVAVFGVSGFLGLLGAFAAPLLKFAGLIGLLAAGGLWVFKNWDKVVEFWQNTLQPAVKKVIAFFKPLVEGIVDKVIEKWGELLAFFGNLVDTWVEFFDELGPELARRFENLPEDIRAIFEKAGDVIGPFFDALMALAGFITDVLMKVIASDEFLDTLEFIWTTATGIIEIALEIIEGALEVFTFILEGDWGAAWDRFLQIFVDVWAIIMTKTEGVRKWFIDIWTGIMDWFHDLWFTGWNAVKDFFVGIWEAIVDFFMGLWEGLVSWFQMIWDSKIVRFLRVVMEIILEIFRIAWQLVLFVIVKAVLGIWNTIVTKFNQVKGFVTTVWNLIKGIIIGVWNIIGPTVRGIVKGIWSFIVFWFNVIKRFLGVLWNGLLTVAKNTWNQIKGAILGPVILAWTGITTFFNLIKGKFDWLLGKAITFVTNIRNWLKKINPLTWLSPPITTTVLAGFDALAGVVTGSLAGIETDVGARVGRIRTEVANLIALRDQRRRLQNTPPTQNGGGPQTNITVSSVAEQNIADEIAWAIRVGGPT